jgi:hypothetical protein
MASLPDGVLKAALRRRPEDRVYILAEGAKLRSWYHVR